MDVIHVFISTGRFRSFEEMREFINETYTEDGEGIPSDFMNEVGMSAYEPGCIEAIPSPTVNPVALSLLLARASYSEQWLHKLDINRSADAAICVFSPNEIEHPEDCSLEHIGRFEYEP